MVGVVITIIAMKGGVGKTTTAINLGAALQRLGKKVLVVDLDGNGSASSSMDALVQDEAATSWNLLRGHGPAEPHENAEGMALFTGDSRLFQADMTLGQEIGREKLLERALAPWKTKFDYILLDCPPAWNLLTVNSMVAADYYLVPVQAQHLALEALRELVVGINRIEKGMGRVPACLGFLLTMVDHRVKATDDLLKDVRMTLKGDVLPVQIPMNNALAQAPRFGSHIFDFKPQARGARAYKALGQLVARRARLHSSKEEKQHA